MIEKLFICPSALRRHKNASFLEERELYLAHKEKEGCAQRQRSDKLTHVC